MTGPIPDAVVDAFRAGRGRHTNHINAGDCCVRAGLAAAAPWLAAAALRNAAADAKANAELSIGQVEARWTATAQWLNRRADELERATPDGDTDG